ncbi:MAG: hypothetical protein M3Y69_06025, partial [Verrucomicrobiota bacterium]|nr:hypothetical protein [Verrucomicrobiota bacterium]
MVVAWQIRWVMRFAVVFGVWAAAIACTVRVARSQQLQLDPRVLRAPILSTGTTSQADQSLRVT